MHADEAAEARRMAAVLAWAAGRDGEPEDAT